MKNIHTNNIIALMHNFQQVDSTGNGKKEIKSFEPPIDPHLLSYIFDDILKFKIEFRPMEKINYFIDYSYKDSLGYIVHSKFDYKIYCKECYESEIYKILTEVKVEIENALLLYSKDAILKNKYSLPNHYYLFTNKLSIIKEDILKTHNKINKFKDRFENNKESIIKNGIKETTIKSKDGKYVMIESPLTKLYVGYENKNRVLKIQLSYLIETYIDNSFSFIEHLLTLLYPMLDEYDENTPYTTFMSKDWRKKMEVLIPYNNIYNRLINDLSKSKEIYRNRLAHGLFSREKQINIRIDKFGLYPLWVGNKFCRGFE